MLDDKSISVNKYKLTEKQNRLYENLFFVLGDLILELLSDYLVYEILLNSDGRLWIEEVQVGLKQVGLIASEHAEIILYSVAGVQNKVISKDYPYLETTLPFYKKLDGQRFSGQIPPIVDAPSFSIRKHSKKIYKIESYTKNNSLTLNQERFVKQSINERKNILICGGPGSGKTTFMNTLLDFAVSEDKKQRFLLLEDTKELQCIAENIISYQSTFDVPLFQLIKIAMRMRPDRIIIGEVRGKEALDMLKAWNTGCPGGICTVHANSCSQGLQRILDLSMEAGLKQTPIDLLNHTVQVIISIKNKGIIDKVAILTGVKNGKFSLQYVY